MQTTVNQIDKFKERKSKAKGNVIITKTTNFIDLTSAIAKGRSNRSVNEVVKTKFRVTTTKEKNWTEPSIFENTAITASFNSISYYLTECHPEVKKFIDNNPIKAIKATCDGLVINTKNRLRITITTIGKFERMVKITDEKKNVLFNNKTIVKIQKQKEPVPEVVQ